MAKPEWGFKRLCQGCGARFYDLKRDPIVCPHCGTVFDPEQVPRYGRRTSAKAAQAEAKSRAAAMADDDIGIKDEAVEEEDEAVLEDASDLGEDDDDMAEVMEHLDEEEPDAS